MCQAISILKNRLDLQLLKRKDLQCRLRQRTQAAEEELVFDFADRSHSPQLPVIHDGRLVIYTWGNRDGQAKKLPQTGWCQEEGLQAGRWSCLSPEQVVIPAQYGLEKGVWFSITEGIQGVVILDSQGVPHAYILTRAASTYFQNMTKHARMPVLVGEQI